MRWSVVVLLWLASLFAMTQCALAQENWLQADFRREGERVGDACKGGFKAAQECGIELFTDHPLHIAAGSMPPQNGFGIGAAFSESWNTKNWRMSWDVDAVGATSGAWRAGGYLTLVHTPAEHDPRNRSDHWRTGSTISEAKEIHAGSPSLHRVQPVCADHLAQQAELLWAGQRFDTGGSFRFWDDANDRWGERDQAGLRMGGDPQAQSGAAGRGEWTLCEYPRESMGNPCHRWRRCTPTPPPRG